MKKGFTLAETLLTITIIGVVAVLTIGTISSNTKETRNKAALKKAINTINGAIALNIAKGERSAFYTDDDNTLYDYLQKNMDVIKATDESAILPANKAFYSSDGAYYVFPKSESAISVELNSTNDEEKEKIGSKISNCGTKGLSVNDANPRARQATPCLILVDINGDERPNKLTTSSTTFLDRYYVLITDKMAIPYGEMAQKAIYE